MNSERPLFTVFTATFNRAHTLHRVYDSLVCQTLQDFEWLIVDDGSTDSTREVVERWQREAAFPIRYYHQPNAGYHMAFNRGAELARGELFLSLGSDDACKPYALERFHHHWMAIPEVEREQFSAVTGLCEDQHGRLHGGRFPVDVLDSDPRELLYRYKTPGEKWGFHRTEVLRQFPFPAVKGVSHVPGNIVWCAIGRHYKTRYVNEVLRIYYCDEGDDALSAVTPAGGARAALLRDTVALSRDLDAFFAAAPRYFLKRAAGVTRFALHERAGIGPWRSLPWRAQALVCLMAPAGFALYCRDRRRVH